MYFIMSQSLRGYSSFGGDVYKPERAVLVKAKIELEMEFPS